MFVILIAHMYNEIEYSLEKMHEGHLGSVCQSLHAIIRWSTMTLANRNVDSLYSALRNNHILDEKQADITS